jgi:hypothetical protein
MMRISWVDRVTNKSLEEVDRKEVCGRIWLREEMN